MVDIDDVIRKIENRIPQPLDIKKEYAIVVPMININGSWELIYELRDKNLNRQPGEISFPGGQLEKGETYRDAAIRETMEELNIEYKNINIIGELDYLVSRDNTTIHSFLAIIQNIDVDDIRPNKGEVDHIFTVPIEFFLNDEPKLYYIELHPAISNDFPYNLIPNGKDYDWKIDRHSVYFYHYNDYIIWGYTAKVTKNFIDIIK
ncbi:CoA pyrophosphatase [Schnuerera sp. xch1]|uniref:NUDIX hydrolase n=1 Tax=Schnuerera sp. xch1 TaxID=2874283 RepID=UPI001CBF788B|nr:CoA pyrophosphatase [Schnuerera sp. xch1]MBZ2174608.1 CoA pyrophosphatase [Schnuerera sp. xch1]